MNHHGPLIDERDRLLLRNRELEAKLAHLETTLSIERHQAKSMDLELKDMNRLIEALQKIRYAARELEARVRHRAVSDTSEMAVLRSTLRDYAEIVKATENRNCLHAQHKAVTVCATCGEKL